MQIRDRIKELRRVKASELLPNPRNWRRHPEAQQNAMRGILAEIGFADAVLARETPEGFQLIDGHLRAEISPDSEVPVLVLDVDEIEAAKILATHDPLAGMAEVDLDALGDLTADLDFGSTAIDEMLADLMPSPPVEVTEDEPPPVQEEAVTRRGDIWTLGEHRLMCGDSCDSMNVQSLVGDRSYQVAIVDPPFNLHTSQWMRWIMDPCIVFATGGMLSVIPDRLWRFERVLLKQRTRRNPATKVLMGHALVVQCGTDKVIPARGTFEGVVKQTGEPDQGKPIRLLVEHLTHWTPNWDTMIDPFAGTGSSLMAAERMGRRALAMEVDPVMCDRIVKRWEQFTGSEAVRNGTIAGTPGVGSTRDAQHT